MDLLIIVLIMVLVIVAGAAIHLTQSGAPFPFQKRNTLYSAPEVAFMIKLEQAVGDQFRVISRVKLNDLLQPEGSVKPRAAQIAKTKASNKSLDFVLLDRKTFEPVAAIDLVNTESKQGYKAKPDWFVRGALETVGIPHVRIRIKAGYKASEIRECLSAKIGKGKLTPLNVRPVEPKGPTRPVKPLIAKMPQDLNGSQAVA
ncbi:DUF2726 domain-containing protein [Catenovulum agarivorans]|uniref:DUF2726 domain-containing protein n=1 Tax=Catenovulum agarivorans TaxID=1172192 RepID=UPI00030EC68B|nr:DUF2726 domain-containing protein [Catenovulum agarivorans]